ncbi:MAG: hypothetical protein OWU32_09190 [Firmicutes bacterium]|nr:hypothetical protein [Bacillota bacterium]
MRRETIRYGLVFISMTVALGLLTAHVTQALFVDAADGHFVSRAMHFVADALLGGP